MLTKMTDEEWEFAVEVFRSARSRRGDKGRDDRKFLEALQYFSVHNINWRALPPEFGNWNSIWKRFWRLSQSGTFEAFFQLLAERSETAHRDRSETTDAAPIWGYCTDLPCANSKATASSARDGVR